MEEITKKVTDKEKELSSIHTRMDADYKRWRLDPYKLDGRKNTISITGNTPRTFADALHRSIGACDRQISIYMAEREGADVRDDIGKLERLLTFGLDMADKRLRRLGKSQLLPSEAWYAMLRGASAVRVLVYMEGDRVVFDIVPLDPRWLTYEYGDDGLLWINYKTFPTQASIEATYNVKLSQKKPVLFDYWEWKNDRPVNTILCGNEILGVNELSKGLSMPILLAPTTTRPPASADYIQDEADSIYAGARDIFLQKNVMASLWATQAKIIAKKPVVNYKGPQGADLNETVYNPDEIINLVEGQNRLSEMPVNDVSNTLLNLYGELSAQEQRATVSNIEYGQLDIRLSGVGIGELKEPSSRILWFILSNLDYLWTGICELIEEQILAGGVDGRVRKVKIKGIDRKKYFEEEVKAIDLKRPHIIKVEHVIRTPWQQLDVLNMAQMAKTLGIPDEVIVEDLLKFQDPKRIEELRAIEMVSKDPVMMIYKAVRRLIAEGRGDEAEYLMQMLHKLAQEQTTQPISGEGRPPEEGIPLPEEEIPPGPSSIGRTSMPLGSEEAMSAEAGKYGGGLV